MCDKELLEAIAHKEVRAYNEFYDRYSYLLYEWALKRIKDRDITDDVSQNFWILVWEEPRMIKLDEDGSAKRFLLHLFNFRMIDYLKAVATRLLTVQNSSSIDEVADHYMYTHVSEDFELAEFNHIIDLIILDLPVMMQEIFTLLYKEELSIKKTAEILRMNEKTVSYKSRACIDFIRNRLEEIQSHDKKYLAHSELVLKIFLVVYFISRN